MNALFVALSCVAVFATCAFALHLPKVKDQEDKPIDPKQIKNATLTFYNNGTYTFFLEVPCDAYLGGGSSAGQQQQQRGGQRQRQQQSGGSQHDEEEEHDDNDSEDDPYGQQQQQRQAAKQRRQQQGGRNASSSSRSAGASPSHEHLSQEELHQAHQGTECECQCKNQEGVELEDVIKVTFGGKGQQSRPQPGQRGGSRQEQQQRLQQSAQSRQRQRQQQSGGGARSQQQGSEDEDHEAPQLVYPETPRPGQKCIFYEDGEWENDKDEVIDAVGPDQKHPGEPEEEVLEKCQFNFKKGGGAQQQQSQQSGSQQQALLQCVDSEGHQDQYVIKVMDGELKPKLTPQQKQAAQKGKSGQPQRRSRED